MQNKASDHFGKFDTLRDYVGHFKANGVSYDPKRGLQIVLDFQDYVGHRSIDATLYEIRETYMENRNDLNDCCWVLSATLGQDLAGELIRKLWWGYSERTMENNLRHLIEEEFDDALVARDSKIKELEERLKAQDEAMARLDDLNTKLQSDTDRIRGALSVLKDFINN